ncbi:hypothetical protein A33Q_2952 [Indibacter alkaliphilus LW1]|uniref:Uncharacterized protein n=1 Tax=Indibacter alkaliphilus (strain CCUG 57479 / KCTC 22604 / LW1) TaxID=1189612 RepID=S2DF12_INDAL|nr:hypothetical protein A33Q_2952 [Indibacter alkaliphilus LW1]
MLFFEAFLRSSKGNHLVEKIKEIGLNCETEVRIVLSGNNPRKPSSKTV